MLYQTTHPRIAVERGKLEKPFAAENFVIYLPRNSRQDIERVRHVANAVQAEQLPSLVCEPDLAHSGEGRGGDGDGGGALGDSGLGGGGDGFGEGEGGGGDGGGGLGPSAKSSIGNLCGCTPC